MNKLIGLAGKFEDKLRSTAAKGKPRTSRAQVLKRIDKSKATYQVERKREASLKKQLEKIETDLEACRQKVRESRSEMLKLKNSLSKMDLADSNYVMLYDNGDCGYIIDGEEYSLDINDDGDLDMLLMKEYRRKKREEERANKSDDSENTDPEDDSEDEDSVEDDNEEALDGPVFPNHRLLE